MTRLRTIGAATLVVLFTPAVFALDMRSTPMTQTALPGTINYVEGSASLNGQRIGRRADGSAMLNAGHTITTKQGHVEMLLTPGVFVRLGQNSEVKMLSSSLTNTAVELERGRAEVEVDLLYKANDIHILMNNTPVQIVDPGLYEFDSANNTVMVFDGRVAAQKANGKWATAGRNHELKLTESGAPAVGKFNEKAQENTALFRWSSLRSNYLAQANEQLADVYPNDEAAGWYWDPYGLDYTFLGPYGFYSPFGWGFYPLGWGWGDWYGPGYYGYGGGWGGWGGFFGRPPMHRPIPMPGSNGAAGGFRPGTAGSHDGSFHGGGGGGGRPVAMPSGGGGGGSAGGGGGGGRPR